jgi:hypothetical protein
VEGKGFLQVESSGTITVCGLADEQTRIKYSGIPEFPAGRRGEIVAVGK